MLTMLLSMFTVMASADEPEEPCMHEDEVGKTTYIYHEAEKATCTKEGHSKYWQCSKCGAVAIYNASLERYEVQSNGIPKTPIDPTNHKDLQPVAAKAATCTEDGNKAYYHCDACKKNFSDAAGSNEITDLTSVKIPATGKHTLDKKNGQEATCTEDGYEAYWECSVCGQKFSDAEGKNKISAPMEIKATGHKGYWTSGQEASCTKDGRKVVWHCDKCGKNFTDETAKTEVTDAELVIKATGHTLTKTDYKAATRTEEGNIAYWHCSVCDKYFADEACTNEITKAQTVIPKLVEEEEHVLTFSIGKNGKLAYADDGREITSGRTKALKSDDKALELVATADKNHKVVWQLDNGKKHYEGSTAKITISYKDLNVKSELKVWFEEITTELDLTIKVSGFDKGDIEYKYNGGKVTDLEKREKTWSLDDKDEYVKFWLYPKTGYKAVVQLNDGKKYTYSYNESLTIDYDDLDGEDGTLYVSFVKKGSSDTDDYPTLTFDITGGKHGTVYRGTREYEHGDVISIKKNDKMTFKAKTDKGYVAVWTYKGESYVGDEYTVKMGSKDAKLYVEFMDKDDIRLTELPFRDVSKRDWYYDDVVYVYRKGYMDGMSSTRFGGELNTTRGQIVTILWRLTGEPRATKRNPFTDVSSSQYYYDAISWAYDAGVVDGFDARTFKPDQNVTREQLAAILYRYAKYMNLSTSGSAYLAKYRDADKIANWAYDAMAWANYRGLINGTSATRIDPKGYATRAQIAAILHRFAVEYGA